MCCWERDPRLRETPAGGAKTIGGRFFRIDFLELFSAQHLERASGKFFILKHEDVYSDRPRPGRSPFSGFF